MLRKLFQIILCLLFSAAILAVISSQTLFFLQFTFLKSFLCSLYWEINRRVSSDSLDTFTWTQHHLCLERKQWRHYSSSSSYSAPGCRIAGMEIQVFRNENSSQTNANLHYSNYSYSRLIPNEHALRHINSSYYPSLKAVSYGPSTKYGGHKGSCVLMTPTIECQSVVSINTLIDLRSTCRSPLGRHVDRYMIDTRPTTGDSRSSVDRIMCRAIVCC